MEKYNKDQLEIFNSPKYKEKVKNHLNREPTLIDIVNHYIEFGDAEEYDKKHPHY